MSDVICVERLPGLCFAPRFGSSAFQIARESDSPRIRWAAQSAEMSLHFIPHTFSV